MSAFSATGISNNKLYPFNVVEENEDDTPICVEFSKNSEFCYNKSEYEETNQENMYSLYNHSFDNNNVYIGYDDCKK